ncbi:Glucan endo-1,3-beta-glucosidase [Arachis hypogaea]|nr:Glucan endo-1,3-beta-glucosidase [Arachis hypogaea]
METLMAKLMVLILFLSMIAPKRADPQRSDDELQAALNWACGSGDADCSKIQVNQPCYYQNTLKDHASYAFNSYFQKFKHRGGSCFFRGSAITTEADPSKF